MAYQIVWTSEAIDSFEKIIEYLSLNFTEVQIRRFVKKTDEKLNLISSNPRMYRRSARFKNIHFSNILRRTILVYRIKVRSQKIELIHFWDGRQNPRRFKT